MLKRCYWCYSPEHGENSAKTPWAIQIETHVTTDLLHCLELDFYLYCEQAFGFAHALTIDRVIVTDVEQTAVYIWMQFFKHDANVDESDYMAILLTLHEIWNEVY